MRIIKTWLLETEDGRTVFLDAQGNYTLDDNPPNKAAEFMEGEHPDDDKEKWSRKVSAFWVSNADVFEERIGQRIKFTDKESGKAGTAAKWIGRQQLTGEQALAIQEFLDRNAPSERL